MCHNWSSESTSISQAWELLHSYSSMQIATGKNRLPNPVMNLLVNNLCNITATIKMKTTLRTSKLKSPTLMIQKVSVLIQLKYLHRMNIAFM